MLFVSLKNDPLWYFLLILFVLRCVEKVVFYQLIRILKILVSIAVLEKNGTYKNIRNSVLRFQKRILSIVKNYEKNYHKVFEEASSLKTNFR